MRVLISNDDGVEAPGIKVLAATLAQVGEVTVIAPDRDRSGASNSLTLDAPIRVVRLDNGFYRVQGTPTDCVHLALAGLLEHEPDIVVSGINNSANLGDDVIYSGTVAAAMEGYLFGVSSIAFSHVDKGHAHLDAAAAAAADIVGRYAAAPMREPVLLNVNVPNRPREALRGIRVTRLGKRHPSEPVIRSTNPRGEPIWWVGATGSAKDSGPGTDFEAVAEGFVSITPLRADLTHHQQLDAVQAWLGGSTAA
jgi:5'-nucleotidase